jgi:DUF1009 family protein
VVAGPAVAPGIIRLAFLDIGQNVMCCNQHAVALEPHMEGQLGYRRRRMAPVGMVQLDERIEAVLCIGIASRAL